MSTGLFYLNETDFEIRKGPKGDSLCVGIDGYSLVLFYSNKCDHCQRLIPIFKKLPGTVGGCTFAMVNVSKKQIVQKSKTTITPIKYVPYVVLHINGEPFMRYDGPHELDPMKKFVIEIAQKVTQKNPRENKQTPIQQEVNPVVPAFTIGVPKNSGPVDSSAYGYFDNAYGANIGK